MKKFNKILNILLFSIIFLFVLSSVSAENIDSNAIDMDDNIILDEMEIPDDVGNSSYNIEDKPAVDDLELIRINEYDYQTDKNLNISSISSLTPVYAQIYTNTVYQTEKFSIYFVDSNGDRLSLNNQPVYFNVNGATYLRYSNEYGISSLNINLAAVSSNYTMTFWYNGNNQYSSFAYTAPLHVIQKSVILTPLSTTVVRGDGYYVKLTDEFNIPISNKNVTININGVNYKRTTNANGVSKLNINLNPSTYTIISSFESQLGYSSHSQIVKSLTVISNNNLQSVVLTPQNSIIKLGTKFKVKLTNSNNVPLANKNVLITINGVTYNKVTDSSGIAGLNINLNGTYQVVINFNGDSSYKSTSTYKLIRSFNPVTDKEYTSSDGSIANYKTSYNYYDNYNYNYITNLASQLTRTCSDDLEKSIAITNYVKCVAYEDYGNAKNSALNALLIYKGNCVDQTSILVALSRAADLPVRYVRGIQSGSTTTGHAWGQICIDNYWVFSDPSSYEDFGEWHNTWNYYNLEYLINWIQPTNPYGLNYN